jgi:hypothetical protein
MADHPDVERVTYVKNLSISGTQMRFYMADGSEVTVTLESSHDTGLSSIERKANDGRV